MRLQAAQVLSKNVEAVQVVSNTESSLTGLDLNHRLPVAATKALPLDLLASFITGVCYSKNDLFCSLSEKQNAYWIGLRRSTTNCQADNNEYFDCWNDGTPLAYNESWHPNEDHGPNESCTTIGFAGSSELIVKYWFSVPCRGLNPQIYNINLPSYICQRDSGGKLFPAIFFRCFYSHFSIEIKINILLYNL